MTIIKYNDKNGNAVYIDEEEYLKIKKSNDSVIKKEDKHIKKKKKRKKLKLSEVKDGELSL